MVLNLILFMDASAYANLSISGQILLYQELSYSATSEWGNRLHDFQVCPYRCAAIGASPFKHSSLPFITNT